MREGFPGESLQGTAMNRLTTVFCMAEFKKADMNPFFLPFSITRCINDVVISAF